MEEIDLDLLPEMGGADGGTVDLDSLPEITDRGAMSRPQGDSPIPLTAAGEAAAKGELGITETAQKDYEAATGAEAPQNPILAQIANMGLTVGGRLNANLQMQAAQKLAAGGNYDDRDMDDLMDQMVYGGVKKVSNALETVPSVVGPGAEMAMFFHGKQRQKQERVPNEILHDWDETEGRRYKDPDERRAARMEYARQIATDFIRERSAVRQNAETELKNRGVTHTANVVSRGLGMLGYTAPYLLGPVGILAQLAEEGSANAVGYANDEYGYDKGGNFVLVSRGDTPGRAALAGFGTAGFETATEVVGGKLGGAVLKRAGKIGGKTLESLAGKTVGRFPVVKKVGEAVGATAARFEATGVGRAVAKFGRGLGRGLSSVFKWTSKNFHLENPVEENIEEYESDLLNALTGFDRRASELVDPETGERTNPWGRFVDANREFFSAKHLVELNEAMLLTMGGGAFVAHCARRGAVREVDDFIREHELMGEAELKEASLEKKSAALDAWAQGLDEKETLAKINGASGWLDRLADKISGEGGKFAGEVNALREKMAAAEAYNTGAELDELDLPHQKFDIPMVKDARGRNVPDFRRVSVLDVRSGKTVERRAVFDDSGICISDNGKEGDSAYTVFMPGERTGRDFATLTQAVRFATNAKNARALDAAKDAMKRKFIGEIVRRDYGGANVIDVKTIGEAVEASRKLGQDVTAAEGFRTDRAGWHLKDGTVVLVRDNIHSPIQAARLLRHENVGHSAELMRDPWLDSDADSQIGRLRDANLANAARGGGVTEEQKERILRESVANAVQRRRHVPGAGGRVAHGIREALRKAGFSLKMNDADLEVVAARVERDLRKGADGSHVSQDAAAVKDLVQFMEPAAGTETVEAEKRERPAGKEGKENGNEAGTVADEEPARPEQGTQGEGQEGKSAPATEETPVAAEGSPSMRTERDFLRVMHDNQKPVRVPVGEVSLPDTQFKEGADPKTGVVKGQELKGEYFESAENAVVVYVRKDGTKELVTGRHRLDLARRTGKKDILARLFYEKDGYTPEDMRNLDAISNIIDEKGTEHDYIRYFENAKPSRAAAEAAGFLSRSKGRLAFELYEGATEGTRSAVDWSGSGADGLISVEQAGIIAKAAPRNAHPRNGAVQRILVKKAQDGLRGDRLAILARSLAEDAKSRKTPATGGEMQLDLFTSEEDLQLLAQEEKRAAKRVERANEYGRIANVLQTAMQKGGRLDLNRAYAKELGIRNPKDRKQLADARQKALEKADYWRNAVRLDEADRAALDAELGIVPKENLELERVTGDQIAEEERKRAERAKIERRKAAPLKGGAGESGQSLMDLGGAEGEDLFNRTQRAEPAAPRVAVFTKKDGTTEPIEGYVVPREGDIVPNREVVVQHDTGGVINARRKIRGAIVSVDGNRVKVSYRDGWNYNAIDTFDRSEIVGVMPLPQTRENAPAGAPQEAEATIPPRAAKPAEGRKSGDAAVLKEPLTAERPAKPVAGGKMTKTLMVGGVPIENGFHKVTVEIEENGRTIRKSVTPEEAEAIGMVMSATLETKPAAPAPKAKAPSVRMKDEAAERKAKAALDAIDFNTPELDGLKSKIRNGTILTEADQRQFAEDVRKGCMLYPRFRADEISASTGKEHGKLWQYILSLESARMDGRRARGGSEVYGKAASQVRRGGSEWGRVGTGSAQSPSVAYSPKYRKLDSGTESEVFDTGDGWVVKVRQIHPLSIGDVIDELAKVVYHNYLFPGEKYVLDDIVRHEHDGYREFYLILRQPFVTPKTENGRIVQPTYAQIWQLMKSRPQGFTFMDLSSRPAETGEYGDYSSSDGDEGEVVPAVKKVAYNRQFVVYDFQPGRNTFIDAKSGKVRFIDPRIDINDPGAGFRYSKYGTRRVFDGDVDFDTPELGVGSTIVSGDEVRKTMRGYNRLDWSTHVDRTGYVGPKLEAQFQRLLKTRKGKGNGHVVFLAGGNGAGKSTVAAKLGGTPDFTIDSTLGNLEVAKKQIDAILANGQTPDIRFVYRTPGQALEGIAQRVKNGGHIVSPLSFANSHVKSRENLRLLSEAYGDRIHIHIYDNSVPGAPEITLEQLEAKGKPDHARIRENANYYLGQLRGRDIEDNKGGVAGGGAKGEGREVQGTGGQDSGGAKGARGQVDFDTSELGIREKQTALSGGTSRNQNPSGNEYGRKWKIFKPGTRNVDIGAGRFDKATKFLADIGVTNIPFDPVNRDSATNRRAAEDVRDNPADTATVHNVLNVIDNDSVMEGIVNQAARAIKKNGSAIFTIYEGNRSGVGARTRDGYQRNAKARSYEPTIKKFFGSVETHGNVILAKKPKDIGPAFWAFDSSFENGIDFDTPEFDPEKFGRLVTGVGKLVDVLVESGHREFKALATYIYERDAAKYGRAKPVLQDIWNAVARARGLSRVGDAEAERVFGIIEAQDKEATDGRELQHRRSSRVDSDGGTTRSRDNGNGPDAGVSAAGRGAENSGGVLAGGRVRTESSDGGVGGVGAGSVPGRTEGRADSGNAEVLQGRGSAGGETAPGNGAVGDSVRPGGSELQDGADNRGDGHNPKLRVKKAAKKAADSTKPNPPRRDFVMTRSVEDAILEKNTAQRVRNNLDAIKLIRDLKARDYAATPEEQATLAKFVGWGGLREKVFGYALERAYDLERTGERDRAMSLLRRERVSQSSYDLHKELRSVLNDSEYESAKASASTAFYTPVDFVRVLHDALRNIGVKGGRFLGPSAGTGNFASAAGEYEKPVNWHFVEKDVMTGEMLKALFPNQRVTIGGFEETKFPDGFFDFAIDNVPYADVPISDRSLSSKMFKIHDYFFAKTLAKLRPGGVMAFLTSTGTLDKTSPILRQFLTEHGGKIVGAVRMPNGFFSENAGTDVASDLVIVQKVQGRPDNSAFEKGVEYGKTEEWVRRKGRIEKPLTYNGYFQNHPEQVVGTMEVASGQFGPTLKYTMPDGASMLEKVGNAVKNAFNGVDRDALLKSAAVAERKDHTPVYDKEGLRQGNVTMKDGKAFIKSGELLEPIALPNDRKLANEMKRRGRTPSGIMEGLLALRKAMRDVIDAQMSESDTVEADLAPLFANLNAVYDAFVQKNGTLHDKWISPFVLLDKADGNRMLALERVEKFKNEKTGKDESRIVKSDIFAKRVISRGQRATKADTPKDALVISYSESGAINVPRIAELLGVSGEEAVKKLKEDGDAFENPQTGLLEPSWVYLSGRVRAKLAAARAAVEAGEESFRANVEALEKVQPPMVRLEDAEIKFGATWVDTECMKDFLRDAFGAENMRISLGKNEVTGQWNMEFGRVMNEDPWGETSWSPQEFVSRVLNHGSMNHYETDPIDKKRHLDERKTEANKLAAEKLHSAFSQFVQSSDKWAAPMYERYNAVMTDMVEIKLPNNVLPFRSAGMSEETLGKLFEGGDPNKPKKGREYQSAVIARGVLGGGSLCLAHCVGAGKTLEMQSIGVLGRHLGLFKKPMYVVPNHMLEQFTNEFVEAFPNVNILKMSESDVKPANRRAFFAQVANGDWDAIVVKHSTFSKKLAMSDEYQKEFMEAQRRDLVEAIAAMREAGEKISVDQATKKLERLEAKLKKLANAENHDSQIVPFEELGVDQLFVDEAHNFKGMPITTRQGRTGGLSQGDSQRAEDMQMKTQYVQSLHGGDRGVVFATGTPLSNAPVVEAYVMLKYLVPNKLDEQGLKHFDDFVDAFGRITTESEFSTDGKTVKEKDKVSAFVNIPELMKLLRSAVDIVNSDQLDIPRPKPKYRMIDVDMSPAQEQIMEMVAREAAIPPTKEQRNKYLTLTRIAKNACLTPRLLGFEDGGNKIIRAVSEIKKVYDETAAERGAQLVFTDIFNESEKTREMVDAYMAASDEKTRGVFESLARRGGKVGTYNLNEEIRDLLVAAGIPKEEIAIVQDIDKSKGDKDANKSALFAKVRSGEVRVLIGSRPKMGEGTNVQERLAAIHLLHPGWKPSEDEQAIGRIIRPGNTYKEGQIFYYLTKGNANIGSYETKNHQLIGVKSKLIDQVMHGDDSRREIDMDESAMDRDMLMGLASGNKALMELIDVKKRAHKLELNTESTLTSARRNKDKAEASGRILERKRGEFAQEQEGVKEWREKNDGKPFALTTPDGRSVEKVKDMAELVSGEITRLLTKDRYDRAERTVLGDFNGVELVLAFDRYGDEKFKLAVPLLGVEREINYSGFVPDFTTAAMTAFKGRILEAVSPDYAKAYENSLNDMEHQAKKMSDDADKLQKDYEGMRGELIKLRTRQAQLEREVTPLVVQAVADRKVAAYGNWLIAKPGGGQYVARRESDAKSLSAPTVKELIPLMDAEDFASPRNAATKTVDLRQRLKSDSKGETPMVSNIPVADIDFDTPELSPAEQAYAEAEDKTPTEQVMREVYGMTNDEIATALKAAAMEPPKHVRKADETAWKQAEALLSNPSYMAKLSSAVAKFPRNIADYENNALNVLFRRRQAAVNAAQSVADSRKETLDALNAIPKGERDADFGESLEAARREYGEAASRLAQAKALMHETGFALTRSSSEAGRRLRSNRGLIDQTDLSYAGISGRMATALGGADKITPEMDAKIREIAGEFASLDEEGRDLATARLKAHAEKIVEQIKRGDKVRKATERKQGDEAKRVMRNYNDALAQIEVGAAEVGGTLVGLSDQQYPAWGKWLRAIGEFNCFENPDITEEECVRAIVEDISPFMDGVDENQVRDALTGFGHNFRQSRYDAQRLMNDLRSQARLKRQMDWMDETNTMPPLTGMVRDEPSDTTRNLQKQVQERKKEVPDAGRDERRLKGVLESAKTRVKNRIADLERAIETGERIPGRDRTVPEDIELRELKKRREELQETYDELFKTERGLTDEQRVKLAERLLGRELEHALEDLDRARSGDFSKRPKRPGVESPSIDALRDRLNEVREQIRELKAAKYKFGMTPDELDAYNARKMANREKALMRLADRIVNGDLRTQKKPQPPMPPEMQKRYDTMGEQMKKARQKLADMRLEAENATLPSFWRKAGDYLRFVTTAQRALRATMDFSAVLRQAARITLAHPVMGVKAFGKAWNAAHSEANLLAVNDEIMSDPSIQEAIAKYGLHLREVDATNARDVEMFHGMERDKVRIFGKEVSITDIPFFGEFMLKSERHYITYLNAVSAELYSSIVNDRTRFPAGPTAWQKKMVADMINIWNGSAALPEERRQALQKAWINDILWAPQLAISRIQSSALYDVWHPLVAKGVKNAEMGAFDAVSAEERKTMFKIGATEHFKSSLAMIALGALLKWLFADEDDWYDFKRADWFEKLLMIVSPKVGNTTIDLTGGEQSVNRAAHKMWKLATSGKVRTGSGRMAEMGSYGGPTVWGVIGRYVQGKTSPWLSELVSLMEGRDYVGNEYTWKDAVMGAAVPLTFEDVKEQLEQNGIGKSLITIPLSLLGAGGSTYDRKVYENAVNPFMEAKKTYDAVTDDGDLDESERRDKLSRPKAANPLLVDGIRDRIASETAIIRRLEADARKVAAIAGEPNADLEAEIARRKADLLKLIRDNR